MISQGKTEIFENITSLQQFSNSEYYHNFADDLVIKFFNKWSIIILSSLQHFQQKALTSSSGVAAELLSLFEQSICPNPLNIQCPQAFENASIFKALYMMKNYVIELNNYRDNYLNNATELYYADSFITLQTLAILFSNRLELIADTLLAKLTAR